MSTRERAGAIIAGFVALIVMSAALAADVPYLSGRVVDDAEILRPATREAITRRLAAHEQKTTDQIAVLTLPSIEFSAQHTIDDGHGSPSFALSRRSYIAAALYKS